VLFNVHAILFTSEKEKKMLSGLVEKAMKKKDYHQQLVLSGAVHLSYSDFLRKRVVKGRGENRVKI